MADLTQWRGGIQGTTQAQGSRCRAIFLGGGQSPGLGNQGWWVRVPSGTAGLRTTAPSRIREPFVPPYDATVVTRLRLAGAVIIGKLNCDDFAMCRFSRAFPHPGVR